MHITIHLKVEICEKRKRTSFIFLLRMSLKRIEFRKNLFITHFKQTLRCTWSSLHFQVKFIYRVTWYISRLVIVIQNLLKLNVLNHCELRVNQLFIVEYNLFIIIRTMLQNVSIALSPRIWKFSLSAFLKSFYPMISDHLPPKQLLCTFSLESL